MHPLDTLLEIALHLTSHQKSALKRIGLATVHDLLWRFPSRYEDFSSLTPIASTAPGEKAAVQASVTKVGTKKMFRQRIPLVEIYIKDSSGAMRAIWFNQPSIAKTFKEGHTVMLSGKVHANKKGEKYFVKPAYEIIQSTSEPIIQMDSAPRPYPVYPEARGMPSQWFETTIGDILPFIRKEPDILPPGILKKYHLPSLWRALEAIHQPKNIAWANAARKRFAFEEIFSIQLDRMRRKKLLEAEPAFSIPPSKNEIEELATRLPFSLTRAQEKAVRDILADFAHPHPMARLLEGDVGSGKTLVAVIVSLAVHKAGYQVAYLAPTEILAHQHFEEFCRHLRYFHASMGLLTSSECRKFPSKVDPSGSTHIAKTQLLKWIRDGSLDILIGTHALIQKTVNFKNLALVIVDEQHRFGVNQRAALARTPNKPHFLSMTATPIPRTLALTIYGDLSLSLLDEMPPGRLRPITSIVPRTKRAAAYEFIRSNIQAGGQAFIICPRIEEKELDASEQPPATSEQRAATTEMRSVKTEYKKLSKEIFPDLRVAMLHGRMLPKEKEKIIQSFRDKKIDILVSTSVIEVGIDIPNASIIVIEGAERFGLASLHQFRGRVGRAGQQGYCFLFTESKSAVSLERLGALVKAKNGFELAEYDLALRGPGELSGSSQWGISDLAMEALKNIKMVEAAREEAQKLIEEDIDLKKYPLLRERMQKLEQQELHFE